MCDRRFLSSWKIYHLGRASSMLFKRHFQSLSLSLTIYAAIPNSAPTDQSESWRDGSTSPQFIRGAFRQQRLEHKWRGRSACVMAHLRMNCRLTKHRPYRTPIHHGDQFSAGGALNSELLPSIALPLKASQVCWSTTPVEARPADCWNLITADRVPSPYSLSIGESNNSSNVNRTCRKITASPNIPGRNSGKSTGPRTTSDRQVISSTKPLFGKNTCR
jgi:hypothetical protein